MADDGEDRDGLELRVRRARGNDHAARSSSSSKPEQSKPVVGQVVAFERSPAAIEAMANRETTGRTIVMVDPA